MGLEELIDAAGMLGGVPRLRLAIAGSRAAARALERRRAAGGGRERIELLGSVDDETLADWYRAADLFVLPTLAYEGFGLATIEALATGTPVLGTPVGSYSRAARAPGRAVARREGTTAGALSAGLRACLGLLTPELA